MRYLKNPKHSRPLWKLELRKTNRYRNFTKPKSNVSSVLTIINILPDQVSCHKLMTIACSMLKRIVLRLITGYMAASTSQQQSATIYQASERELSLLSSIPKAAKMLSLRSPSLHQQMTIPDRFSSYNASCLCCLILLVSNCCSWSSYHDQKKTTSRPWGIKGTTVMYKPYTVLSDFFSLHVTSLWRKLTCNFSAREQDWQDNDDRFCSHNWNTDIPELKNFFCYFCPQYLYTTYARTTC